VGGVYFTPTLPYCQWRKKKGAYVPEVLFSSGPILQDEAPARIAEFARDDGAGAVVHGVFFRIDAGCVLEGGDGDFGREAVVCSESFLCFRRRGRDRVSFAGLTKLARGERGVLDP